MQEQHQGATLGSSCGELSQSVRCQNAHVNGSVNTRGVRSFAASLALHVFVVLGLALATRAPAKNAAHSAASDVAAWSGETFDVADVVRAARRASEPEPERGRPTRTHSPAAPSALPTPPLRPSSASVSAPGKSATLASPSVTDSPAPPGSSVGAAPGAFGAAGLPPGVRNLAAAFCRAIPPATRSDPAWQVLPLGPAGSLRALIVVDDSGRIASAEADPDEHRQSPPAPHMKRLLDKTVMLLGGGAFALSAQTGAGSEKLAIEVELSQRAPSDDAEPGHMMSQGYRAPTLATPGHAYFTLGSGRHFEARVTIVRE
jgi:hypothetical protein